MEGLGRVGIVVGCARVGNEKGEGRDGARGSWGGWRDEEVVGEGDSPGREGRYGHVGLIGGGGGEREGHIGDCRVVFGVRKVREAACGFQTG